MAIIGFLLLRRKTRTERNAANANDGHVYTVEPQAITIAPPVPMAQEFEGEFDKHDMQYEGEFDKHDMPPTVLSPISAQIVSYDHATEACASKAESTVSPDEASASAASATMNPVHATEFYQHDMQHTVPPPSSTQIASTAEPDASKAESTVSHDEAFASAASATMDPVHAPNGNDNYFDPMTADMAEDGDFIQSF